MTETPAIEATLLYDAVPEFLEDGLRTDLRVLAGKHGLPVSGTSDVGDGKVRLACLPFEIRVQLVKEPLPASAFAGAISANVRSSQRAPLAEVISDHRAYVKISVRDTGERHGVREVIIPSAQNGLAETRLATIFAQDVVRTVIRQIEPKAYHWHPSNQLALPGGLMNMDFGRMYLPVCLKLRCTSAALTDTGVVNMAQDIQGAAGFLGRPLHVMALSLNRFETLQLAVAFLDRMLEGEARPIGGAVFRDQRGTRVQVIDQPANEVHPDGLIALVELDGEEKPRAAHLSKSVQSSRDKVATRASARVKSRDLNRAAKHSEDRIKQPLNEVQAAALKKGLENADFTDPPENAAQNLPTIDRLRELRDRASANKG